MATIIVIIRMPSTYQAGKIYKIIDKRNQSTIYIGSTKRSLAARYWEHLNKECKGWRDMQVHIQTHGKEHFKIELIELYPCNTRSELELRERVVIEEFGIDNLFNKNLPAGCAIYGGIKEFRKYHHKKYREREGENLLKKKREYYHKNKERISQKAYRVVECECGGTYTYHHKSRHYKSKKHLENLN